MEDNKDNDNEKPGAGEVKSVETEGKTPAEAIEKALRILNVAREDVKVQILSEEEKGLFGMEGARPAKVKVTLRRQSGLPTGRQGRKRLDKK